MRSASTSRLGSMVQCSASTLSFVCIDVKSSTTKESLSCVRAPCLVPWLVCVSECEVVLQVERWSLFERCALAPLERRSELLVDSLRHESSLLLHPRTRSSTAWVPCPKPPRCGTTRPTWSPLTFWYSVHTSVGARPTCTSQRPCVRTCARGRRRSSSRVLGVDSPRLRSAW